MTWAARLGLDRLGLDRSDLSLTAWGAGLILAVVQLSRMLGEPLSLAILVAFGVFFLVIVAFVSVPHISVAVMIPIFILLPMLKVLVVPWIGPLKDIIGLAAICAGVALVVHRANSNQKALADFWVTIMVGFLMALYVINLGGGLHRDLAWAHGVRLFSEPLLLLLVGMTLSNARRTFRWMMASLIVCACFVALVGIAQQALGDTRLVQMGYEYNSYVRFIGGHLRSFGTLDDPFGYAGFLLFGLAGVFIWMRRGFLAYLAGTIISVGLVFSYVRSAAVIAVALIALVLARHGRSVIAASLTVTVIVSGMLLVASEQAVQKRTIRGSKSAYVTINGRTEAWKVVFEDPWDIPLGRGVGQVGTAAERATYTISRSAQPCASRACNQEVDSGYFATIADIGLVGLVGLLLLNGRLAVLARRAAVRGSPAGWTALAFLAILLLDAITRESFNAFPTAFLGLLFLGIAVRASAEEIERDEPRRALGKT